MDMTEGNGTPSSNIRLDSGHEEVFGRLLSRQKVPPSDHQRLAELEELHLAHPDIHSKDHPVALSPLEAFDALIARTRQQVLESFDQFEESWGPMHRMADAWAKERHGGSRGGVRILATADDANAALVESLSRATTTLHTAQPTQRRPDALLASMERDGEAVQGGLHMRTIYTTSSRRRDHVIQWVNYMTRLGVEVRTCPMQFRRIIIIEDVAAYIAAEREAPDSAGPVPSAIEVTDPELMSWIKMIYDDYWDLSQPWRPGAPQQGEESDTLTTPRQRALLRMMGTGRSTSQILRALDFSERALSLEKKNLREAFGVQSDFELALAWRDSPEYNLPG